MSSIQHFLLVFDHVQDKLLEQREFGTDAALAMERYAEKEAQYRDSNAVDIVLVGSDSIDTVKVTHSTYFDGFTSDASDRLLEQLG